MTRLLRSILLVIGPLLIPVGKSSAQIIIHGTAELGYFIIHSDNQLPVTENNNYRYFYGFNIGLTPVSIFGLHFTVEAGFTEAHASNILDFSYYQGGDPNLYKAYASLVQRTFPFTFAVIFSHSNTIQYSFGLSAVLQNRELSLPLPNTGNAMIDSFNLIGFGPHFFFRALYPLTINEDLLLIGDAKLNYLTSIWNDPRGRDLSNFTLNYVQSSIALGLGIRL